MPRSALRILPPVLGLAGLVAAGAALSAPAEPIPPVTLAPAQPPAPPSSFPLMRVVPRGEARTIAFFASLFPDCSTQGAVVIRTLEPPRHGSIVLAEADSFPRYGPGSPLVACNTRKVPGLKMTYAAEEGFEGLDTFRIFVINADGTGYESEVKVSVR